MARPRSTVRWLAFLLAVATPAAAQHESHVGNIGYVPQAILEKPLPIRSGIGTVSEKVSTASAEALAFYQQGVAYLHSYVWVEAARSFHQALRLDPELAMAWVGLSRAWSGLDDAGAARAAVGRAQALSEHAGPRERRWIEIRRLQLDAIADLADVAKHVAVKRAVDEALSHDLDNVELWLFRGNLEEATAAGRGQRGGAASVAFYERALKLEPENFAAHHYLIHSFETVGDIQSALRHGEVYARLASQIPHARHMYGHDLRRVGKTEEAIAEFLRADELERAYYQKEAMPAAYDWHHQHNLDLLSTSYQYLGQMRTAERLMREAFAMDSVSDYLEYSKREWIGFLLGRGRSAEALETARSLAASAGRGGRLVGELGSARALLALGRLDEARQALANAEREQQALPVIAAMPGLARGTIEPEISLVRAEILLRSGEPAQARAIVEQTVSRLRAQLGPDAWSQTLFRLEGLARTARASGDWQLAEYAATQMLEHDPAYAGTHYELALVAAHKGDPARAQEELALAARYWSRADADLPELQDCKTRMASAGTK
jgi:tetratricopeptide (TPR) repeat protein